MLTSIHQGLVTLLSEDRDLLLDLVRVVTRARWPDHVRIEETTPNLELLKLFSNKPAGTPPKREQSVYRLFPDLIFKVYDADGELVGVLVVEVQLRGDDDKTYKLSAYRASAQVHHGIMAELLGVSSDPAGRNRLRSLRAKVKDPPDVVELAAVTQVCNPQAEWLLDPNNPGPPRTREQLEKELAIARNRPRAALFHAVHHGRDERACQIVLAALLVASELGIDAWERYSAMIFESKG